MAGPPGKLYGCSRSGPVYKLLGAKDIGVSNNYLTEKMPAVNTGLLDGELAWRQHDGGHTDAPNFKYFIPWASREMKYEKSRYNNSDKS